MSMSQKEAVFRAVTVVTGFNGDGICAPTREQRAMINTILFEGFRKGEIELEREFTDQELKAYVSGLQSNWLRKDKRLNGGIKYEAKNPGSRAGVGDPQLKAMRALLAGLTDPAQRAEVQRYIDARVAELAAISAPQVDLSALPEALRTKFTKN